MLVRDVGLMIAFLLSLAVSSYATSISACANLTAGTSYTLTADITNYAYSPCFTTLGDGVTLDCGAHTVDGNDIAAYGFRSQYNNTHVFNCTFTDWGGQALAIDGATSTSALIHDINATSQSGTASDVYIVPTLLTNMNITAYNLNLSYGATPSYYPFVLGSVSKLQLNNSVFGIGGSGYSVYFAGAAFPANLSMTNVTMDYGRVRLTAWDKSDLNITDITSQNAVLIKAINETSGTRIFFNVTYTNGVYSDSGLNKYTFISNSTNFTGMPQFVISNGTGYVSRTFTPTITTYLNMTAALSGASTLANKVFLVTTSNGQPITGALVYAYVRYFGYWIAVAGFGTTDAAGTVLFNLDYTTQYYVVTTASGFATSTSFIYPVNTQYTIILSPNSSIGFLYPNTNVSCEFNPGIASIGNITTNFTLRIFAAGNATIFDYYGWDLYNGTTLANSSNISSTTGGFLNYTITPYNSTTILVDGFYKLAGNNTVWHCNYQYYVYYTSVNLTRFNYTLSKLLDTMGSNDGGGFGTGFISMMFLVLATCAGTLVAFYSQLGGVAVYIIVLGVGSVNNAIPVSWVIMTSVVAIGLILLMGKLREM